MSFQVPEFIWTLPPSASYDEVETAFRRLRRVYRWERFKDRFRRRPV